MVALGAMIFTACSDDDDKDKDFPKEDPTDPNIVRTITLTIEASGTVKFTLDNEDWLYNNEDISDIDRISFPKDLIIDWGDGSITHSNSHKYETAGKYNIIISAKDLKWFSNGISANITAIDLKKCNSLVGLRLYQDYIYELNIAGFTELKYLNITNSGLKHLNVDGCNKLTYCYLRDYNLESININDCKSLKILDLSKNHLKELNNIPKGNQLESLDLSFNEITTIDLSNCSLLQELDLSYNELTSLDISKCSALTFLDCRGNNLSSLDMSKNTKLTNLACRDNELTSLNISGCSVLTYLSCSYNNLSDEALNKIFTDLPQINNSNEYRIYIHHNPGTATCDPSIANKKGWIVEAYGY